MQSILNLIENKSRYKVLTFAVHERTQSNMSDIDADFYLYSKPPHIKNWNNNYAKLPENHFILPVEYLPEAIPFDFVISQNKFGQFEVAQQISQKLQIPLISLEHTWPTSNIPKKHIDYMKGMIGDVNVYIGKTQAQAWEAKNPVIIRHCVDTDIFKPFQTYDHLPQKERVNHILTVANDYPNRDYVLGFTQYLKVTKDLPTFPIGDSPGFSEAAKNTTDLASIYANSRIFLNTSIQSPIPTSLLEAMASGCACVSTNNCEIPYYIDHGINGLLANSDQEMRKYLENLVKDKDLAYFLGNNARQTILKKCSKSEFTKQWNNTFKSIIDNQNRITETK